MSDADTNKPEEKEEKPVPKGYKRKKEIPPVSFLLKHGDPETVDKPQTWAEMYGPPVFIMITFVMSFFVFKYFIENHTTHRPMTLPRMPKQMTNRAHQKATKGPPKRDTEL